MKKEEEQKEKRIRQHKGLHFQTKLRDELIKAMESGVPRSVIAFEYGMSRATLSKWMRDYGSKVYQDKQRGDGLTDEEKKSIVGQVEQGILTPYAARKEYGLSGDVLNKWLKASLKENAELAVYDPFEMKDTSTGQPGLPNPEKEALKKALEDARLKISALNTLINVAEDQFKIKIRKKAGARQS